MNMSRLVSSKEGRNKGLQLGIEHGRRMGRCQFVLDTCKPAGIPLREVSVLFIPQGFDAIDTGIIEGLQQTVRVVHTATATDMLRLAAELRPNLVLVMNGLHVFPADHAAHIDAIRRMGIRTAIWFADDPYFTDYSTPLAPHYDYVFTHEMSCIPLYQGAGCQQVHYLPLASSQSLFKPMQVGHEYRSDVCFIGVGFPNRIALFNTIAPYLVGRKVILAGPLWHQLQHFSQFKNGIHLQGVPMRESVNYYNGAKIVLNMHRLTYDATYNKNSRNLPGLSINPRTYEISGCGALQITDRRSDLANYYTPGHDIETFDHPNELIHKINHYLIHEEERLRIATNALRRTILEHTYAARLAKLLDIIFT